MSELYDILKVENKYYDRKNYDSQEEYNAALATSSTVYVGNLSFYSTQDSIRELFSIAGKAKYIIIGIDNYGNSCGFCFVIFENRKDAAYAVEYLSKTKLNDRIIRVDWDPGYKKGREKGRGTNGQQRRDDFRSKYDAYRPKKRTIEDREGKYERRYRHDHSERGYDKGESRRRDRNEHEGDKMIQY